MFKKSLSSTARALLAVGTLGIACASNAAPVLSSSITPFPSTYTVSLQKSDGSAIELPGLNMYSTEFLISSFVQRGSNGSGLFSYSAVFTFTPTDVNGTPTGAGPYTLNTTGSGTNRSFDVQLDSFNGNPGSYFGRLTEASFAGTIQGASIAVALQPAAIPGGTWIFTESGDDFLISVPALTINAQYQINGGPPIFTPPLADANGEVPEPATGLLLLPAFLSGLLVMRRRAQKTA